MATITRARKSNLTARQLKELLADDGSLRPNGCFLSEKEVSDKFSVSRTTSRRALQVLVNAGYLEAKHGKGYEIKRLPDNSDRLRLGKLGLIVRPNDFEDKAVLIGHNVITQLAAEKNYQIVPITTDQFPHIDQSDFKGFLAVVCPTQLPVAITMPVVTVGTQPYSPYPNATVDSVQTGALIGQHLSKLGHRCIALLESEIQNDVDYQEEVLRGIRQQVTPGTKVIHWLEGRRFPPYEATIELLAHFPEITALVILRIRENAPAMTAIHKLGIDIPAELSVVGGVNSGLGPYCYPPLTCVEDYPDRFFAAALRLLLETIGADGDLGIRHILTGVELVARESTSVARAYPMLSLTVGTSFRQ